MNAAQALKELAQSMPTRARLLAYQTALVCLLAASACVFFEAPEILGVAWEKLLAALALASGVLHGVASQNMIEEN